MKIPVAQTNNFTIYYERHNGNTFTHADVKKWSKEIKETFLATHKVLHAIHGQPFFALVDNKKLTKFVYLLGYRPLTTVQCNDGVPRTIWIYNGE